MGVFGGDGGHNQVALGAVWQVMAGGDDVGEQRGVNAGVVAPLLEGEAIDLPCAVDA